MLSNQFLTDAAPGLGSALAGAVPPRRETPRDRRDRLEGDLRRQGLEVRDCPTCGEAAAVEECVVRRPGQGTLVQRVLRCHSPRKRCPPQVLEERPRGSAGGPNARECPICTQRFEPRVANQKVCPARDCRREWKRLYMRGFWERQRQDLARLKEETRRRREPLPLPRLAQELAALPGEDFDAVLALARAERQRGTRTAPSAAS